MYMYIYIGGLQKSLFYLLLYYHCTLIRLKAFFLYTTLLPFTKSCKVQDQKPAKKA